MANLKPSGSIAAAVHNIKSLFTELVNTYTAIDADRDEVGPLSAPAVQDMLDRFRLWAGSLGATHQPQSKLSLEQRLICAPEILAHVREHLSELQESLDDALGLNSPSSKHRESKISAAGQEVRSVTEYGDQDDASVGELAEEITECIRSLFRIAIVVKRASPRDRFAQALKSSQYAFTDTFDIYHVAEKFPKLRSSDNAWLRRRLGSAIAKRRQFIKYCHEHKLHLEGENDDFDASERQSAKATTLIPGMLNERSLEEREDDDVVSFATTTTVSDSSNSLSLPRLESLSPDGEPFECPICHTLQLFHHDKSWKLHAFGDLKAYVCTRGQSEKCERLFFADRSAWFQHELSMHLGSYRCSLCGVNSTSGRDGLRQHLNDVHKELTQDQLSSLVDTGICVPNFFQPRDCPFCEDWSMLLQQKSEGRGSHQKVSISRLRRHVATHQEDLALFAMPRNIDFEVKESLSELMSDESGSHHSSDEKLPHGVRLKHLFTLPIQAISSDLPGPIGIKTVSRTEMEKLIREVSTRLAEFQDEKGKGSPAQAP
ncbi:hypothetical protein F4679DRAFT_581156 [Xylaria curta]|nr:hypothetical protein F4679DRAFT_581156 [Xylaria curta]